MNKRKYKRMQGEPNYKGKFYMTLDANIVELIKLSKKALSKILTAGFNGSCIKFLDIPTNKVKFVIDYPMSEKYHGEFVSIEKDSDRGFTVSVGELCWAVAKAFKKLYATTTSPTVSINGLAIEALVYNPETESFVVKVGSQKGPQ